MLELFKLQFSWNTTSKFNVRLPATMSATISGPVVLENPHSVEGSSRSIEFDGQMWLTSINALRGRFRYFNSDDITFNEIGYYFAWIHVRRSIVLSYCCLTTTSGCEGGSRYQRLDRGSWSGGSRRAGLRIWNFAWRLPYIWWHRKGAL